MDYKNNMVKPLLFMVFNRPEKTARVWAEIRKAKPEKLYISIDGPRADRPADAEKCAQVLEIINNVDWDCDVKRLIHKENLGCTLAGKTAFDWVFSMEEEMIQLEDDVLPTQSFFWFMQEMLEKYKDNKRIGLICSENFGITFGDDTYFYTQFGSSGGWAMFKRNYLLWEYKLESLDETINTSKFKKTFLSNFHYEFMKRKFYSYKNHGGNTYDLQTVYLTHKYNLLNIVPNINLNTNIGWDGEAKGRDSIKIDDPNALKFGNRPSFELDEIIYPKEIISADKYIGLKWLEYHQLGGLSKTHHRIRWAFSSPIMAPIKRAIRPIYRKILKKD